MALPKAQISCDRYHVVAMAVDAMDKVRQAEMRDEPEAVASNDPLAARVELNAWLSWARRCRLEPFKKLAKTIRERADAAVRGMTDNRSNTFVEAMNGLLQQAKRAARGFRISANFIAIAYLRLSKIKHLPDHPVAPPALAK